MDEKTLVNLSTQYFTEAKDARRLIENSWQERFNLTNNLFDFSKKAEWQSKNVVPKISNALRQGVAILKDALIRATKLFTIETNKNDYKQAIPVIEENIEYWLRKNKFIDKFVETLTYGFITSMSILKIFWRVKSSIIENPIESMALPYQATDVVKKKKVDTQLKIAEALTGIQMTPPEQKQEGELVISVVSPFDFYIDPTGRNRYIIHRVVMDLADFKELCKQYGYNKSVVDEIEEDYSRQDEEVKENIRKGQYSGITPTFRKKVELLEYWGDIIDESNVLVNRNITWTIANKKYVVRNPIKNPFLHKKAPFVICPIILKAGAVYHKAPIEDAVPMAYAMNDIFNLIYDGNSFSMANAFELDMDKVYDPEQLLNGIYPGMVLKKRGDGTDIPMIKSVPLGQIPVQALRLYQEADREFQNATGLTEFLLGKPATRGRPTATEVKVKGAQSQSLINDIAYDIEDRLITPLIEMIFTTCLQYQTNFDNVKLDKIKQEVIQEIELITNGSLEEKKKYVGAMSFTAKGITGVLEREERLQKLLQLVGAIGQLGPMAIQKYLKLDVIIRLATRLFGFDEDEVLNSPEEIAKIEQQIQVQQLAQQNISANRGGQTNEQSK